MKPDQGAAYAKLIEEKGLPLFREAGGRAVAWWSTLVGDLYEHVTIWEYDDLAAFERAVRLLGADERSHRFAAIANWSSLAVSYPSTMPQERLLLPPLSIVEIVMEIEEVFGVKLSDAVAETISPTPGGLKRFLEARVLLRPEEGPCPVLRGFHRIRRALCAQVGLARREVLPSSRFEDLLPREGRPEAWEALGEALGVSLPCDTRSHSSREALITLVTLLPMGALLAAAALHDQLRLGTSWVALVPGAILLSAVAALAISSGRSRRLWQLPAGLATVGHLARLLPALGAKGAPIEPRSAWTRSELFATVDRIILERAKTSDFSDETPLKD